MKKLFLVLSLFISFTAQMTASDASFYHQEAAKDFVASGDMTNSPSFEYLAVNIINEENIQCARSMGCSSTCSSGCSMQCSSTCSMRCGR